MAQQANGTSAGKILIVDDDPGVVEAHAMAIKQFGYEVATETDPQRVLNLLGKSQDIDLILLDIVMPQINGIDLLKKIKSAHPRVGVIMVTVIDRVSQVVAAMKMGAFSYLEKPVDIAHFKQELFSYFSANPKILSKDPRFASFVTCSPVMNRIFYLIKSLAEKNVPVLIEGETGTGKELVAHLIHSLSPFAGERFLSLNVSAIPSGLFESELFGHCKGAFTGALADHAGYMQETGKGTLFLDEIGDLEYDHQKKLLRSLETLRYQRVGETKERQFRGRIVMATHRDLRQEVSEKRFRDDLYYRLSPYRITLPPLRDRPEDIGLLATYFLRKHCALHNIPLKELAPETMYILNSYPFFGNVRELEGIVGNAIIVERGTTILPSSLPPIVRHDAALQHDLKSKMKSTQYRIVADALNKCGGNRTKAADKLGISRSTLYRLRGEQ